MLTPDLFIRRPVAAIAAFPLRRESSNAASSRDAAYGCDPR
jgi:hypothetical protein